MTHLAGRTVLDDEGLETRVPLLARQLVAIHALRPAERPREYVALTTADTVVPPNGADAAAWAAAIDVIRRPAPPYEGRFLHRDFHPGNVLFDVPPPSPAGARITGVVLADLAATTGVSEPLEPTPQTHEGFEWLYVLGGRLRLVTGERDLTLPPGEAAEFDTSLPHWLGSADGGVVELLILFGPQGVRLSGRSVTEGILGELTSAIGRFSTGSSSDGAGRTVQIGADAVRPRPCPLAGPGRRARTCR